MNHRPAALAAALGFLVEGVCALGHRELAFDGAVYHHLLDAGYAVAMAGCAIAVVPYARLLSPARSVVGAAWVGRVGFAAMGIESAVGAVHRVDALGPLFTLGILLALLGGLTLTATAAATGRPRWAGALPLVAMVVAAAGGEIGASVLSGALWALAARTRSDSAGTELLRAGSTSGSAS